jgi:hypothetical protein
MESPALVRKRLEAELRRGERELGQPRSGYGEPVLVAFSPEAAALPVPLNVRADAAEIGERAWLVVAAAVEALVQAGGAEALEAGAAGEHLALRMGGVDPELAVLAFDEAVADVDRLRARGTVVALGVIQATDWRRPLARSLRVAEAVAKLGGRPGDQASVDEHEDAVLRMLGAEDRDVPRPHDDPDPAKRIARRILQRLDGMGKWGGYHTEFAHLARGFAPAERSLASDIGEALLDAGLLAEKPSVGQRHVFLDPRRVKDIRGLIERGEVPAGLSLPQK